MADRTTVVLGLGVLGLAGLVTWAFWPKKHHSLGDRHQVDQSARFYTKKYGISAEDAHKLVTSPQRGKIEREIEEWRAQYGYPDNASPLVRGFVRDRVRALAGLGRTGSTNMLRIIAAESKSPEEYARRAEAWASSEARPPSVNSIAAAYIAKHRGIKMAQLKKLIQNAEAAHYAARGKRWQGYMRQPAEEPEDLID